MKYLNLKIETLLSPEFVSATPIDRATWICLLRYCAQHETGGRIKGAKTWDERQTIGLLSVTRRELQRKSSLWSWDGDDTIVWSYPVEHEEACRAQREAGAKYGRGRPKTPPKNSPKKPKTPPPTANDEKVSDSSPNSLPIGSAKRSADSSPNRSPDSLVIDNRNSNRNRKSNKEDIYMSSGGKSEGYVRVIELYRDLCPSLPQIRAHPKRRIKATEARMKENPDEVFLELFRKAEASDFLTGKTKHQWRASFDWLMNETNMAKVLEGTYDNRPIEPREDKYDSGF